MTATDACEGVTEEEEVRLLLVTKVGITKEKEVRLLPVMSSLISRLFPMCMVSRNEPGCKASYESA